MAVAGAWIRLHSLYLADVDSEDLGGFLGRLLSYRVTLAAPHHQRAADPKQRGRVLDYNLKRSQSSGGDDVNRRRPLFDSGINDFDIAQIALPDGAVQELALTLRALNEMHVRIGQRDRQRQPGESGTRSEVRDRSRGSDCIELEADE